VTSPTVKKMLRPNAQARSRASEKPCTPVACKDCGIYNLCFAVGGDTDLSALDTIVKSRRVYKRGEYLYRAGEPLRSIYAIRYGSIKTYVLTSDGRIQITGFHVTGEVLGLSAMATSRYNCEARALESASLCEVPIDHLNELCERIPAVRPQMLRLMSQEIQHNQELMLLLGKKNAEERLATFLLGMSRRFGKRSFSPTQFNLSMSRGDIGNYLGLAEETVCRVFTRFQEEGLISTERRQIELLDVDRLNAIARA
jgi:CRP/FNR family transcriptional regulator